jgi:hypothetical protein
MVLSSAMAAMSMTKPSVSPKSWMVYTIHICFLLCIHQQLTKVFGFNIAITKLTGKLHVNVMELDTTYLIFRFLVLQLYICPYAIVTTRRQQNAKIDVFWTSVSSEA